MSGELSGCRIVAAYSQGSPDIQSSVSRVPGYTAEIQTSGAEIVPSIEALLEKVDVVFLETNDGRPHLEQVLPVLKAKKPVFFDKPIAASLVDAAKIVQVAEEAGVHVGIDSRRIDGALPTAARCRTLHAAPHPTGPSRPRPRRASLVRARREELQ